MVWFSVCLLRFYVECQHRLFIGYMYTFFFDSLTFQFSFFCTHTQNFAESMIPKQFYKRFELWTTVFLFDQLFRFCLFRINLFILFFEPHFLRTKYEIFNNSMGLREYVVNFNYVYLLLNSRWMFPGSSYLYKKTQLEKMIFLLPSFDCVIPWQIDPKLFHWRRICKKCISPCCCATKLFWPIQMLWAVYFDSLISSDSVSSNAAQRIFKLKHSICEYFNCTPKQRKRFEM